MSDHHDYGPRYIKVRPETLELYREGVKAIENHINKLQSQLQAETERRKEAEKFMDRANEFKDGGVNIQRWYDLMMDIQAYKQKYQDKP